MILASLAGVVILGMIMSILDTTIVNVALQTLHKDLHSPLVDIQWVITGYLLALAVVIPISGWASRRFGAKNTLVKNYLGLAESNGAEVIPMTTVTGFEQREFDVGRTAVDRQDARIS